MWFGSLGDGQQQEQVREGGSKLFSLQNEMQNERPFEHTGIYSKTCKYLSLSPLTEDWGVCTLLVALEEVSAAEAGWVEVPTESYFGYPAPRGW